MDSDCKNNNFCNEIALNNRFFTIFALVTKKAILIMKKFWLMAMMVALLTSCVGKENPSSPVDDKGTENKEVKSAKEFIALDLDKDWDENPFTWFKGQGLLLAVGDKDHNNAMTIGWGALGNVWSKLGPHTVTVYVAEQRYTYEFMEKYDYFTVMAFDKEDAPILGYMGTHSGRDGDKAAHLGLHTLYTENGTPYYEEAELVLECKVLYRAPFLKEGMSDEVKEFYGNFGAGVHHMYIGNVVGAWIKD